MRILFITLICLVGLCSTKAQDVTFTVEVRTDSILMGNYFQVTFKIENGAVKNFEAPSFQGFSIIGGPNQSSSMSIINGVSSQSMSYTYFLKPQEEGQFFIEPASVEIEDTILETEPIEIKVVPNPEGIIQRPERRENRIFDSFFDFPSFPKEEQKKTKPKKKRKTVKI